MRTTYINIALILTLGLAIAWQAGRKSLPDAAIRQEIKQLVHEDIWGAYDRHKIPQLSRMIDWKKVRQLRGR
jgi:hypothetical protein